VSVQEEIFVPFPSPIPPLRHARSTILVGAIAVVRDSPYWDAYVKALDAPSREVLLTSVAAAWIPLAAAAAHYRACDTLPFSVDEQVANGRKTFDRAGGIIFGTVMKMAKEAGVTPWTLLAQFHRFWARSYDGGGVRVLRRGPKEAHVDVVQSPLFEYRYFRNAVRGVILSAVDMFCTKGYMTERQVARPHDGVAYRIQWA
jgi:hypothetical protein